MPSRRQLQSYSPNVYQKDVCHNVEEREDGEDLQNMKLQTYQELQTSVSVIKRIL